MCIFRVELKYSLSHSLALVVMFYHSNRKKSKVWAFLSLLWRHQWPHNMKAVNSNRLGGNQGSEENQLKAFWASSPSGHIQVEQPWASRSASLNLSLPMWSARLRMTVAASEAHHRHPVCLGSVGVQSTSMIHCQQMCEAAGHACHSREAGRQRLVLSSFSPSHSVKDPSLWHCPHSSGSSYFN